jgi:hypothetical protein
MNSWIKIYTAKKYIYIKIPAPSRLASCVTRHTYVELLIIPKSQMFVKIISGKINSKTGIWLVLKVQKTNKLASTK